MMMTYDERKMCIGYANLIDIADRIQYIYKLGAYDLLTKDAKRKFTEAESLVGDILGEAQQYVANHTTKDEEKQ